MPISPGPIAAATNRLFTMNGSWGRHEHSNLIVYMQILRTAGEDGEIKMKHFTEITNEKRQIIFIQEILYKAFTSLSSSVQIL